MTGLTGTEPKQNETSKPKQSIHVTERLTLSCICTNLYTK